MLCLCLFQYLFLTQLFFDRPCHSLNQASWNWSSTGMSASVEITLTQPYQGSLYPSLLISTPDILRFIVSHRTFSRLSGSNTTSQRFSESYTALPRLNVSYTTSQGLSTSYKASQRLHVFFTASQRLNVSQTALSRLNVHYTASQGLGTSYKASQRLCIFHSLTKTQCFLDSLIKAHLTQSQSQCIHQSPQRLSVSMYTTHLYQFSVYTTQPFHGWQQQGGEKLVM